MRIGKITENVLKRSIWKIARKTYTDNSAEGYTDCAVFATDNNSTNICSSIATWTLDIENAGKYAVVNAVNNLAAAGADVKELMISIVMPEDAEEKKLRQIMEDAANAAVYFGAEIKSGQTEVSPAVKNCIITVSAVGEKINSENKDTEIKPQKGDAIIMTKWIGLSGSAILADEGRDVIDKHYPPFIRNAGVSFGKLEYLEVVKDAEIAKRCRVKVMHDVSFGGIFASLWELGQMTGHGFDVYLNRIPIRQETVEMTDILNVNPYQMTSQGALLFVTSNADKALEEFEKEGINAQVIGYLKNTNDKVIYNDEEKRFLDLPQTDSIVAYKYSR